MKAGDHIRILKDGEWQHAIDVGDRTVIHFAAAGGVKRSRLDSLSAGAQRVEVVTHPERVYAPKMVVARAFSRFSESAFGAMFSDSESFAVWCKSGGSPPAARNGVAPSIRTADEPVAAALRVDDEAVTPAGASATDLEPARRRTRRVKKVVRLAGVATAKRAKAAAKPAKQSRAKAAPKRAAAGATKAKQKAGAGRRTPAARKARGNAAAKGTKRSRRIVAAAAPRSGAKRKGSARTPAGRAGARRRA